MFWRKPKWSSSPGCFERHLQRREGSLLFPIERRKISKSEIIKAQKKDQGEQASFIAAVKNLGEELENSENDIPGSTVSDSTSLQKVQNLLEVAAAIGGNIQNAVQMLESTETEMIQHLNQSIPAGADLLEQADSLSKTARIPFIAQSTRKDSPILPEENIATLLSEDLETISAIGIISRSFPNFKPCEADIKVHLDSSVEQGFDFERATELIAAWNKCSTQQDNKPD